MVIATYPVRGSSQTLSEPQAWAMRQERQQRERTNRPTRAGLKLALVCW
jgi:hypothetical protein